MGALRVLAVARGHPGGRCRDTRFASSIRRPVRRSTWRYLRTGWLTPGCPAGYLAFGMITLIASVPRYILWEAEDQGLLLPFACRMGCCTACAVRVKSGELHQPQVWPGTGMDSLSNSSKTDSGFHHVAVARRVQGAAEFRLCAHVRLISKE